MGYKSKMLMECLKSIAKPHGLAILCAPGNSKIEGSIVRLHTQMPFIDAMSIEMEGVKLTQMASVWDSVVKHVATSVWCADNYDEDYICKEIYKSAKRHRKFRRYTDGTFITDCENTEKKDMKI